MNKQIIALISVLTALSGGLATGLVKCFNSQQEMIERQSDTISQMNELFIEQSKQHEAKVSTLHTDYNAKIIDIIIKGR